MALSVNTNPGALAALQSLNTTNQDLGQVQQRINTGLKVNGYKDNAAIFSIAQNLRSDQSGLNAVKQSLDNASSILDVSLAAGEEVSNIIGDLKEKAAAAADPSIDSSSRDALNNEFQELVKQIDTIVDNASFNGTNILDGSTTNVSALVSTELDTSGSTAVAENITVSGTDLNTTALSGNDTEGNSTLVANLSISTEAGAVDAITILAQVQSSVNADLAKIGSGAKAVDSQRNFVSKLSDTIETGIGNLVDADLAKESAKLQSLQVKQQLGTQALSIANQAPQTVLSLFR